LAGRPHRGRREGRQGGEGPRRAALHLPHGLTAIAPRPLERTADRWLGRLGGPRAPDPARTARFSRNADRRSHAAGPRHAAALARTPAFMAEKGFRLDGHPTS
jgi:hypothetical protein